jgi:hypothetical protein
VLTGCRGYALGEHGAVGGDCSDLYSAVLHIPCLLRATGMDPAPPRRGGLATPTDLAATLAAWFGVADEGGVLAGEDLLTSTASTRAEVVSVGPDGQTSVRTENWFLRTRSAPLEQAGELLELYAKPDDRWDANEVADRCPDEVGELLALLGDAVQHGHSRP